MLDNQTLEQLRRLRLSVMAAAYAQRLEQPNCRLCPSKNASPYCSIGNSTCARTAVSTVSYNWRVCGNWLVSKTSTTRTAAASSAR